VLNYNKWLHDLIVINSNVWIPTLSGTAPVPPWTASTNYVAANWAVAGGILTTTGTTNHQWIVAGLNLTDVQITIPLALTYPTSSTGIAAARVNTTTGASYNLVYVGSTKTLILYRGTNLTNATQFTVATAVLPSLGTTQHTWVWQLKGAQQVISIDGQQYLDVYDTNLTSGDIALMSYLEGATYGNYVAKVPTFYPCTLPTISGQWLSLYNTLYAGYLLAASVRYVNLSTGQATPEVTASCLTT
jgi:hypothetical protein